MHDHAPAPSPWIARFLALAPAGGRVLDVAAGGGRHTRLALERGYKATAVDIDTQRLADLGDIAEAEIVAADLEGEPWPFGTRRFAVVIVANYLHRPLLPALVAAVEQGGALLYETFAQGNEAYGKPSNPNFLLAPGELLEAVRGALTVVAYEHGAVQSPRPAVIQRIAAVHSANDVPPLPPVL
ncbi:MAG: class I SAM-dependent methyltransferase [Rhodospirillaceae bacterium]|nr:class I SAM-dependent methyltransferase [Rhodospirillaceae bacterium]